MSHAKEAHSAKEPEHKAHDKLHVPAGFIHVGNRLVRFDAVAAIELPVAGDPKQPLAIVFANGQRMQLNDEDGAAFLAAAGKVK